MTDLRPALFTNDPADLASHSVRFAKEVLGLDPWPRQIEMLAEIDRSNARIVVMRLGRRAGKGFLSALLGVEEATARAAEHRAAVRKGEQCVVAIISNSLEQSRIMHRYIRQFLEVDGLRGLIKSDNQTEIVLKNDMVLTCLPASGRTARGRAIAVGIWDEAAHALDGDGRLLSPQGASELWEALAPSVMQFPQGKLIVLSTPRWTSGLFHTLCEQAASGSYPDMLHIHAASQEVNPTLDPASLERERQRDPSLWKREWMAEFDSGVGALFDADAVNAAVVHRDALPPQPGVTYVCSIDPAYSGDRFGLALGHVNDAGRLIVDRTHAWQGSHSRPVDHATVLTEVATWAKAYNGARIVTDQFASAAVESGLRERGCLVEAVAWTSANKIEAAQAARQRFYSGTIELPDDRALVAELCNLEQRPSPAGKPRIQGVGHDDRAMALLGLVAAVEHEVAPAGVTIEPDSGTFASSAYQARIREHPDRPQNWGLMARHRSDRITRITR
jgi:hypothetical protein